MKLRKGEKKRSGGDSERENMNRLSQNNQSSVAVTGE